jgi:hypothetical protein
MRPVDPVVVGALVVCPVAGVLVAGADVIFRMISVAEEQSATVFS